MKTIDIIFLQEKYCKETETFYFGSKLFLFLAVCTGVWCVFTNGLFGRILLILITLLLFKGSISHFKMGLNEKKIVQRIAKKDFCVETIPIQRIDKEMEGSVYEYDIIFEHGLEIDDIKENEIGNYQVGDLFFVVYINKNDKPTHYSLYSCKEYILNPEIQEVMSKTKKIFSETAVC